MPTGSNATHTLTNKELEDTLREVIQRLIDGQQNLLKVGEYLKDDILKLYCEEESLKRAVSLVSGSGPSLRGRPRYEENRHSLWRHSPHLERY
jgi:hypothetical protein